MEWLGYDSVGVIGVAFLIGLTSRHNIDLKLVLLVTAGIGVGHQVKDVRVAVDGGGRCEVEFNLGLLVEGEPLDAEKRVGFGVANHAPPVLLPLLREQGRNDRARHFILTLHGHVDKHLLELY